MTITINQTPVDFTLDTEKTLAEVLTALEGWAAAQQWTVASVLVNGRADFQSDLPVSQVEIVEVETVPREDDEASRWDVVAAYFTLVGQASGDPGMLAELHGEFGPVRQKVTPWERTSGLVARALEALDSVWGEGSREPALVLAKAATNRAADFRDPQGALRRALDALAAQLTARSNLAVQFQRGNDADALSWVLDLFSAIHEVGLWAGAHPVWNQVWTELPPFLREIEAALGAQDYILATDLIEYEVGPRLDEALIQLSEKDNLDRVPGVL